MKNMHTWEGLDGKRTPLIYVWLVDMVMVIFLPLVFFYDLNTVLAATILPFTKGLHSQRQDRIINVPRTHTHLQLDILGS